VMARLCLADALAVSDFLKIDGITIMNRNHSFF
jgi:hypothetical protein